MAGEIVRPSALSTERTSPVATEWMVTDNGATVAKVTIQKVVEAGRPAASEAEAVAGSDAQKAMTPLTTKQAVTARIGVDIASKVQGDKADSAIQSIVEGSGISVDATDPQNPTVSYSGSGVADGDKGDVIVSGAGTNWAVKPRFFNNRADAEAANIAASLDAIVVSSSVEADLGAPFIMRRTASGSPTNRAQLQAADGTWWDNGEKILFASQFRYDADGTNWGPAIQAMIDRAVKGQTCVIDAPHPDLAEGLPILPSAFADRCINVDKPIYLVGQGEGGRLTWNSSVPGTCDIIRIQVPHNEYMTVIFDNLWAVPTGFVERSPQRVYDLFEAGQLYARDVLRIESVQADGVTMGGGVLRNSTFRNCTFGPAQGRGVRSLFGLQGGQPHGVVVGSTFESVEYYNGMELQLGDSNNLLRNRPMGMTTAMIIETAAGASSLNIFGICGSTANGLLRIKSGSRTYMRGCNMEQYGQATGQGGGMVAPIVIDHSGTEQQIVFEMDDNFIAIFKEESTAGSGVYPDSGMTSLVRVDDARNVRIGPSNTFSADTAQTGLAVGVSVGANVDYISISPLATFTHDSGTILNHSLDAASEGVIGVARNLTLSNSWANASSVAPSAVMDDDRMVTVEGYVAGGTTTVGTVMATLPTKMRPIDTRTFPVYTASGMGFVEVNTAGQIRVVSGVSAATTCLDGIHFKAAPRVLTTSS